MNVRLAKESDWEKIRKICCDTGKSGNPIESDRFQYFSEIWIGPYQKIYPEWTFVIEENQKVLGYITGCPNTIRFERKKLIFHTIPLLASVCLNQLYKSQDLKRLLKKTLGLQNDPEKEFSIQTKHLLASRYPAHLHINIDKSIRGKGIGNLLIQRFEKELISKNISGVHLYCGKGPVEFYKKNSYEILEKILFNNKTEVFAMAHLLS